MIRAAETGGAQALGLMLDLGFPVDARGGDNGATALHIAAHSGSLGVVRLLLDRGADVEARDGTWDGTPLAWAVIGSSEQLSSNPQPTGPAPSGPCSRPGPPLRASRSRPTSSSSPARRSPPCCAAVADR